MPVIALFCAWYMNDKKDCVKYSCPLLGRYEYLTQSFVKENHSIICPL